MEALIKKNIMPAKYAKITSLTPGELKDLFRWMCDNVYKKSDLDVKKTILHISGKKTKITTTPITTDHIMKMIKHKNIPFELKISWEVDERPVDERKAEAQKAPDNLYKGYKKDRAQKDIEKQALEVTNEDLLIVMNSGLSTDKVIPEERIISPDEIKMPDFI